MSVPGKQCQSVSSSYTSFHLTVTFPDPTGQCAVLVAGR